MEYPEHSQLIAFIKGELDESQRIEVSNWISASPEHAAHYDRVRNVWDLHGSKADSYQPNLEAAWNQIESSINGNRNLWHWVYQIAAAITLLIGITYFMTRREDVPSASELSEHIATASSRLINLPDGSMITLKKGSRVFFHESFDQSTRYVKLEGEAFFEVTRDENRPFIIETDYSKTEVLGTSFSISTSDEVTVLNVVSGKVAFSATSGERLIFSKGDRGSLSSSGELTRSNNTDANFLSWQTGKLLFENTALKAVLHDLERHYEIQIQSEVTEERTLTAQFNNQPIEEVLAIIASTLELDIQAIDSTTYTVK